MAPFGLLLRYATVLSYLFFCCRRSIRKYHWDEDGNNNVKRQIRHAQAATSDANASGDEALKSGGESLYF